MTPPCKFLASISPNAESVYQRLLGFERRQTTIALYRWCRKNFRFPHPSPPDRRTYHLLSIGTGYGRADLPILKACLDHFGRAAGVSFRIDCVEPSARFRDMLLQTLRRDALGFFSSPPNINRPSRGMWRVRGTTPSGHAVTVRIYPMGIAQFLEARRKTRFHCMIASLSLQYVPKARRAFSTLLAKLSDSGVIMLAASCSQGAWLSRPPLHPPRERKHRRWFDLWTDWHLARKIYAAPYRSHDILPHDLSALASALERLGFVSCLPRRACEFVWEKTVSAGTLKHMERLIQRGSWEGCISALHLEAPAHVKHRLLRALKRGQKPLSGAWATHGRASYLNGLRMYVYAKEPGAGRSGGSRDLEHRKNSEKASIADDKIVGILHRQRNARAP